MGGELILLACAITPSNIGQPSVSRPDPSLHPLEPERALKYYVRSEAEVVNSHTYPVVSIFSGLSR